MRTNEWPPTNYFNIDARIGLWWRSTRWLGRGIDLKPLPNRLFWRSDTIRLRRMSLHQSYPDIGSCDREIVIIFRQSIYRLPTMLLWCFYSGWLSGYVAGGFTFHSAIRNLKSEIIKAGRRVFERSTRFQLR